MKQPKVRNLAPPPPKRPVQTTGQAQVISLCIQDRTLWIPRASQKRQQTTGHHPIVKVRHPGAAGTPENLPNKWSHPIANLTTKMPTETQQGQHHEKITLEQSDPPQDATRSLARQTTRQ